MIGYPALRTLHLLCGVFALPALVMYGVSAVQMAHPKWFSVRPSVTQVEIPARSGYGNGRQLARDVMAERGLHGEITSVKKMPGGFEVRVSVPGTVHEIRYDDAAGRVQVRSSVSGVIGMLNRLHHAAGMRYDYRPLQLWGLLSVLVSVAALGLGVTGIWMWWLRSEERTWGVVLISLNLAFAITVLVLVRAAGP